MFWTEKWFTKNQAPFNREIGRRLNELETHYTSLHNRLNKIVDYIETKLTESFNSQIEALAQYVDKKIITTKKYKKNTLEDRNIGCETLEIPKSYKQKTTKRKK